MPALLTNTSILLDTTWASSSTESLLLRSACGAKSTCNNGVNGVKMKATLLKEFCPNQRIVWIVFAPKAAGTNAAGQESAAELQSMMVMVTVR